MDAEEKAKAACRSFSERFRDSSWLVCAGVGVADDGRPCIRAYTMRKGEARRLQSQIPEWEGVPVFFRHSGPLRLC